MNGKGWMTAAWITAAIMLAGLAESRVQYHEGRPHDGAADAGDMRMILKRLDRLEIKMDELLLR